MHTLFHHPESLSGRCDPGVLDFGGHVDPARFHLGIGSLDLLRALRVSRQKCRPLALNVQLPTERADDAYLQSLLHEIDLVGCHLGAGRRIEQFHLGGRTPPVAQLRELMSHLRRRFNFLEHDGGDYSIDVDLRHTAWSTMGALRDLGFNHVSIGVPDVGGQGEATLANYQNPAPIHSLLDAARTFGFRSVNVDLGYGHAWQTPESFAQKLASILELEPDRLLVFDYARPPQRYRSSPAGAYCSEQDKAAMRRICFEQLADAGYHYLGLGQFVRPDDDLAIAQERGRLRRHCEGFTRHGYCDNIGLGLGAISQLEELYAQNVDQPKRYQQLLDMDQLPTCRGWRCEVGNQISHMVVERLACDLELDIAALEARYGLVFRQYFRDAWPMLEHLQRNGLIDLSERFISILPGGRPQLDAICNLFQTPAGDAQRDAHSDWINHDPFF